MELTSILILIAGFLVGINIGANDASNAVGTAVGAGILNFRNAVIIVFVFALLGATLEGHKVIKTIGKGIVPEVTCNETIDCQRTDRYYCHKEAEQEIGVCKNKLSRAKMIYLEKDTRSVLAALFATCSFVFIITLKKLPVSTTQAIVGGVAGAGLGLRLFGGMTTDIKYSVLMKVFLSWILTPLGSAVFAYVFYFIIVSPLSRIKDRDLYNFLLKILVIGSAIFVSYNIGANDVANAVAPVVGANIFDEAGTTLAFSSETVGDISLTFSLLPSFIFAFLGGITIGIGAISFGKGVVQTMGSGITQLGPLTAFAAQFASAVTVYLFTQQGIPVSTTQAIVGGVIGVGFTKGTKTVNFKTVRNIMLGWLATPTSAALLAMTYYYILIHII